jgi:non-specific protein-tyrosine kinase
MALEQYLAVIKKWWWLIVASTLIAAVSSYFSVSRMPRTYQATTTVIVGQSLSKANPTYEDFSISGQLARTYISMVQRQPILQAAAEALGLPYVPRGGNVSAQIVPGTQLLEISVRDTSPERARAIADEIAHQLILQTPTDSAEDQSRFTFVQTQLLKLENSIQETEEEIRAEQAELDAANSARAIQQFQSNIAALQQKQASYQSTYASLLQTVQGGTNYISVIEPATTPTRPISPRVRETVLLAAAIGLALAMGGSFTIEFLNNTVKTSDDVRLATDLPTLGAIAHIKGQEYQDKLVAAQDPRSTIAEALRMLRTNIEFSSIDAPLCTLVVTSPSPMEGKSIILANLAVVMAQAGRSVIVVDADMRRPMQHKIFGLDNDRGLSDAFLHSDPSLSAYSSGLGSEFLSRLLSHGEERKPTECTQASAVGNLRVVTSGSLPPNPADLIGSRRMEELVEELKSQADVVLFDTPPMLMVTDAVLLAAKADGVLLLCEAGRTRRATAREAVERLRQVGANLLGVVLNRVSLRGRDYYGYGYYDDQHTKRTLLGKLQRSGNHRGAGQRRPVGAVDRVEEQH